MATDDFDSEIELIYNEIRGRLSRGESLGDFDSETLVEVYDFAYDNSDELVTFELMQLVLSREPMNEDMLARKAVRYAQLGDFQAMKAFTGKLPQSSFIRKLLDMQLTWDSDNPDASFSQLFSGIKEATLDDYCGICIIDFAMGQNELPYLVELLPKITPLLQYPADFIADLAATLDENGFHAEAVKVYLELTVLEPFSVENWLSIANIALNQLHNIEETSSALDYALALEPENTKALLLKADLMIRTEHPAAEIAPLLDDLAKRTDTQKEALFLKAGLAARDMDEATAANCLEKYIEFEEDSLKVFSFLFTLNDGKLSEKVKKKFITLARRCYPEEVKEWLGELAGNAPFNIVMEALTLIDECGIEIDPSLYELLLFEKYRQGKWEEALLFYSTITSKTMPSPSAKLLFCFACMRLGRSTEVLPVLKKIPEESKQCYSLEGPKGVCAILGTNSIATLAINLIESHKSGATLKPSQINAIDPFCSFQKL